MAAANRFHPIAADLEGAVPDAENDRDESKKGKHVPFRKRGFAFCASLIFVRILVACFLAFFVFPFNVMRRFMKTVLFVVDEVRRVLRDPKNEASVSAICFTTATRALVNLAIFVRVRLPPNVDGVRNLLYGNHLPMPIELVIDILWPVVGGLSFIPFLSHVNTGSTLRNCCFVACVGSNFCSFALEVSCFMAAVIAPRNVLSFASWVSLRWGTRLGLSAVTWVKLKTLGWKLTGNSCFMAWGFWLLLHVARTLGGPGLMIAAGAVKTVSNLVETVLAGFWNILRGIASFSYITLLPALTPCCMTPQRPITMHVRDRYDKIMSHEADWTQKTDWTQHESFLTSFSSSYLDWGLLVITTLVPAFILLCEGFAKFRIATDHKKDKELFRQASRTVWFLCFGACLMIFDAMYLPYVEAFGTDIGIGLDPFMGLAPFFAIDDILVLSSVLILGGFFDSEGALGLEEVIDELQYMARTKGKRIAFPGQVNLSSHHCIVSFPGKYAAEWDAAVRMVLRRSGTCSLACVFLTDEASGLGQHVPMSQQQGRCWCNALYGHVPASEYISIIDNPRSMSEQDILFKKQDAAAMGQVLLLRDNHSDEQWEEEKRKAEEQANLKCMQNQGLAPWGCFWFAAWKCKIEEATKLGQKLHVFYFKDKVGCGKVNWQDLSDDIVVQTARADSGLGRSQTAEVAYMEEHGYTFEEHDVAEFENFMERHRLNPQVSTRSYD